MLNSKLYVKILFFILFILFGTSAAYTYQFSKQYPLPFTNRISVDAKIKFIREKIDVRKIDTIVVGSSIGLNNVQGVYLEKASKKCKSVLNLSVYEASPVQVEQLLELMSAFPSLKRVIYSAQFSDFQHASVFKDYKPKIIAKYISHTLNPAATAKFVFDASKNLPFLIQRKEEWIKKHGHSNTFTYLGFDRTGSVPLHIYGKDIVKKRWNNPHGSLHPPKALEALDRIARKMQEKGIKFYFVQQPYRQELIKKHKHIPAELNWFLGIVTKIITPYHGKVLSLYKELPLNDAYFADRSHLNDKGSILSAEAIGKFIDNEEK